MPVPENILTNLSLVATASQIGSAALQDLTTNILIYLSTAPGQSLQGTQQISMLNFSAATNQISSFLNLSAMNAIGQKPSGLTYSNYVSNAGTVAVVQDQPLLQAFVSSNLARNLTLYGKPGFNYQLLFKTNLISPTGWQPLLNYTLTNGVVKIVVNPSNPVIFYRAQQH